MEQGEICDQNLWVVMDNGGKYLHLVPTDAVTHCTIRKTVGQIKCNRQ